MIYDIGRVCVKIAGRDAGKTCVVVESIDDKYVLVDGQTRRRKCNISHLEPTKKVLSIKAGAAHDAVVKVLEEQGIKVEKAGASRSAAPRPKKAHKQNAKPEAKSAKK